MPDRYCIEYLARVGNNPSDWEWKATIVSEAKDAEDAADRLMQKTPDLDLDTALRITPLDDDLGGLYKIDVTEVDGIVIREVEEDDEGEYYLV